MTGEAREPPVPTRASKERVHDFAEDVARRLGFHPGDLLEPIVSSLGGTIALQSPFDFFDEPPSIVVEGPRKFTIHLPVTTSPRRNRFTVAHELGHLFLHYPMVQKAKPGACMVATRQVDEHDPTQQRAEWEANWFAAGFLMPRGQFLARLSALRGDVSAVAEEFDVSLSAASLRAKTLGHTIAA
jgi:predicted transcriptional regulator